MKVAYRYENPYVHPAIINQNVGNCIILINVLLTQAIYCMTFQKHSFSERDIFWDWKFWFLGPPSDLWVEIKLMVFCYVWNLDHRVYFWHKVILKFLIYSFSLVTDWLDLITFIINFVGFKQKITIMCYSFFVLDISVRQSRKLVSLDLCPWVDQTKIG